MTDTNPTIGAKIRSLRGLNFMTQAQLAEAIGTEQYVISRLEKGLAVPNSEAKIIAIGKYFGVELQSEPCAA